AIQTVFMTGGTVGTVWFLWVSAVNKPAFTSWTPYILAALLVPSVFLFNTSWKRALVWVILITQLFIPTWFHPFPKHYQQSYPLLVLLLASALIVPVLSLTSRRIPMLQNTARALTIVAMLVPFFTISSYLFEHKSFNPLIDQYNVDVALDTVVYRAVQTARHLPGPYGVSEAYLPARVYFGDKAHYFIDSADSEPGIVYDWIDRTGVQTLIITNNTPAFSNLEVDWRLEGHFVSEGEDERLFESWVYSRQI
ncbi:MAG: hypothetical protein ACRD4B_00455, partial [Acidobacteriota bacterium]